ncbi:hypothetical protein FRC05_004262 [Tulasnella sp. 425]|nr:hypothetical protein FRC05_004262 [Tulasnella sp. 425]
MSSSNKLTNTATGPLNGEAPLSGSGAILESKDAEKNAGNLSDSVDPTAVTAADAMTQPPSTPGIVDHSHPSQIIPHIKKKRGCVLTKEAEKIMQIMPAMGTIYDNPDLLFVIPHFEAFIQAYDLKVKDLLEPDIKKYKSPDDLCTNMVKGQEFTLPTLLDDPHLAGTFDKNPGIAIFRLAPQDYHRYHAPFKTKRGKMFHVTRTYFTVDVQTNDN